MRNKLQDRFFKVLMPHKMCRASQSRNKTPGNFMLALSARLKHSQSLFYAVFDALIITGFKMKALDSFITAPETSIKT